MLRPESALSLLAPALLLFGLQGQGPSPRPEEHARTTLPSTAPVPHCPDRLPIAPVIVFDVSGSTLAGPHYMHVAVYGDGHAVAARLGPDPDTGQAAVALLTPDEVLQLRADLELANSFGLCDDPTHATDIPTTTVTVFRGGTNADAHTFSYILSAGPHGLVQQIVDQLVATKFPGF